MQSLLAYLVMHCDAPQLREQLAFLFWRDSREAHARAGLRQLLYGLRQALPEIDALLVIDHRTVQWRAGALLTVDVAAFSALLAEARQAVAPPAARAALERALALYGGELLPACYDDWVLRERERLHQHYLDALEQVSRLCSDQGDLSSALAYAQRLVQADPLQESAYRLLMQLHLRDGDRARALRVYHTCATLLTDELGVEPSPETQLLFQRLLNLDALPLTQPLPVPQPSVRSLVGRHREWEMLLQVWQMTAQEQPRFALIAGEAGIGKSRLAQELLLWANERNITAIQARAYAAEGSLVYAPVLDWLRSEPLRSALARLDPVWRSEIGRLLPEVFVLQPDLPRPEPLAEQWQRQRLFEALARAFVAAAPLLLVLDDLQWCDRETLEWLHYLLRFDPKAALLVAGTVRPEEVDAEHALTTLLLNLRSAGQLAEIELGSLGADDSATLAAQVAERKLDAETAGHLYQITEGNPLFIVETVRASLRSLGPGEKTRPSPGHLSMLPSKVQAVIQARLAQLSSAARDLAQLAATIGREFTVDVLAQASVLDAETFVRSLDELWRRRIVREQGANAYDFSHDKIRETAYLQLSPVRRRQLHRQVTEALQSIYADQVDEVSAQLAYHCEQAGSLEAAIGYYQQAAEHARRVYAYNQMIELLRRGLALLPRLPSTPARKRQEVSLLRALGAVLTTVKGQSTPELEELWQRTSLLCQEIGDLWALFSAQTGLRVYYSVAAKWQMARQFAESNLLLAQQIGDPGLVADAQLGLGVLLHLGGEYLPSQKHLEQALTLRPLTEGHFLDKSNSIRLEVRLKTRYIMGVWIVGYPTQAIAHMTQLLGRIRASSQPFELVFTLAWAARLEIYLRNLQAVHLYCQDLIAKATKFGFPAYVFHGLVMEGWALALEGQTEQGIAQMQRAMHDFKQSNYYMSRSFYLALLVEAYLQSGQVHAALELVDATLKEIDEELGELFWLAELHRLKGELWLRQGKVESETHFQNAIAIARRQGAKSLELRATTGLCRLWANQGKTKEARVTLSALYGEFTEGFDTADLKEASSLLEELS
jgi:DNA-binding SARP family transcriptional activator